MGLTINGDLHELANQIEAFIATVDMNMPGVEGSLGKDLATTVATCISERANAGLGPNGQPLRPNEPTYAAAKQRKYGVDRPGELSGQMLSLRSLKGRVVISGATVTITYGTGQAPSSPKTRTGAKLPASAGKATDREKLAWFEASGREVFALDTAGKDRERLEAVARESLERHAAAWFKG